MVDSVQINNLVMEYASKEEVYDWKRNKWETKSFCCIERFFRQLFSCFMDSPIEICARQTLNEFAYMLEHVRSTDGMKKLKERVINPPTTKLPTSLQPLFDRVVYLCDEAERSIEEAAEILRSWNEWRPTPLTDLKKVVFPVGTKLVVNNHMAHGNDPNGMSVCLQHPENAYPVGYLQDGTAITLNKDTKHITLLNVSGEISGRTFSVQNYWKMIKPENGDQIFIGDYSLRSILEQAKASGRYRVADDHFEMTCNGSEVYSWISTAVSGVVSSFTNIPQSHDPDYDYDYED